MRSPRKRWFSFISGYRNGGTTSLQRENQLSILISVMIFTLILFEIGNFFTNTIHTSFLTFFHPVTPMTNGMYIQQAQNGDFIGISEGKYVFDTYSGRQEVSIQSKQQAAQALSSDVSKAEALWNNALQYDPKDVETRIYQENQNVLDMGVSYFSLFIGVSFGNNNFTRGSREVLQGAHIAQKAWNRQHPRGPSLRLLIANVGSSAANALIVAQKIIQYHKIDPTAFAVMGWPSSAYTLNAITVLNRSHILVISQMSSADSLSGKGANFFRIVPRNREETSLGAKYAYAVNKYRRVAIFENETDLYSQNLVQDFMDDFRQVGGSIVTTQLFDPAKSNDFNHLLQNAFNYKPDFIYFAGNSPELGQLLNVLPSDGPYSSIRVMSGDTGYALISYQNQQNSKISRLFFTSPVYPDEWNMPSLPSQAVTFFSDYAKIFQAESMQDNDDNSMHAPGPLAILSYDATSVLLYGCWQALHSSKSFQRQEDLQNALMQVENTDTLQNVLEQVNSTHPFQGVSGQIAFNRDHDVENKLLVVVSVDEQGTLQVVSSQGCFQAGDCHL